MLCQYAYPSGRSVVSLVASSSWISLDDLETINVYMSFSAYEHHICMAIAFNGLCKQTVTVLHLMEAEGIEPNLIMLNLLTNPYRLEGIWRNYLFSSISRTV